MVIADLTGLNANVFYELGLAHAMNKKVIIITQNISELPFDISSYHAIQYSSQFSKFPELIKELEKVLFGTINGKVQYGNPVADYMPNFYKSSLLKESNNKFEKMENHQDYNIEKDEKEGVLDYFADINENLIRMSKEMKKIVNTIKKVNISRGKAIEELDDVELQNENKDRDFTLNVCRKLSTHIELYVIEIEKNIEEISQFWGIVGNAFLALLDSKHIEHEGYIKCLKVSMDILDNMKYTIKKVDSNIEEFIKSISIISGIEKTLSNSLSMFIEKFDKYLKMTSTIVSSIDRILINAEIVMKN